MSVDRCPSFLSLHSYAKDGKKSSKRGRIESSPTGKTPIRQSKRCQIVENIDPSCMRKWWTYEKKEYVRGYVEDAGGVPNTESSIFWETCASKLNEHCSSNRTASMCRAQFLKVRKLFEGASSRLSSNTRNASTQTDIALPTQSRNFSKSGSLVHGDDINVVSADASVKQITDSLKRTYYWGDETIPDIEKQNLLEQLLLRETPIDNFVSIILQQPKVTAKIKAALLAKSREGATSRCIRSQDSYLFCTKYPHLKDFSFENILNEISIYQTIY